MSSILDALKKLEADKTARQLQDNEDRPFHLESARAELLGRSHKERKPLKQSPLAWAAIGVTGAVVLVVLSVAASVALLRPDAEGVVVAQQPPETPSANAISPPVKEKQEAAPVVAPEAVPASGETPSTPEPVVKETPPAQPSAPIQVAKVEVITPVVTAPVVTAPVAAPEPVPASAEPPSTPEPVVKETPPAQPSPPIQVAKVEVKTPVVTAPVVAPEPAPEPRQTVPPEIEMVAKTPPDPPRTPEPTPDPTPAIAPPPARRSPAPLPPNFDLHTLPLLRHSERVEFGLESMAINMLREVSPDRPYGQAIINLNKLYIGETIPNTQVQMIGVARDGIAIEVLGTGERFFVQN